ncbi:MAG TPA: CoA ester lyase [archaeon]|nr:CoA ester lyase [archaeon]
MGGRSYLYVPGDQHTKLQRAISFGADAIIIDLEDSVAFSSKSAARMLLESWLKDLSSGELATSHLPEIWVRINPFTSNEPNATQADLTVAVAPGVAGVCLAKCQSPSEISQLNNLLVEAESRAGLEVGSIRVSALLESARGILSAESIATSERIERLQIGEADLCADLGLNPGSDELELLPLRSLVVLASASAGLEGPIGPVSTDFRNLDDFRNSTERLKRLGFTARALIHPAQIPVSNEVFTPTDEEIAAAQTLIEEFHSAFTRGEGVLVDVHGKMVDEAVVRAARRTLARAARE